MAAITVDPTYDVLIVVDVQNDFCPGGALPVPDGDKVISPINRLLGYPWLTVATKDWHPHNHCSFKEQGGPWPMHCIQDSNGADFHPHLDVSKIRLVVAKGYRVEKDAYSGFDGTDLAKLLHERGVKRVVVCGLATEYCVRATALDALKEGLEVIVVQDAIRGVEVTTGDCERAIEELKASGVRFVLSSDLSMN